jgi:hypothetical protein
VTPGSCRWHEDPNGRCAAPLAFPGTEEVPPFCMHHLSQLEPWIRRRAAARQTDGEAWIRWAARKAEETGDELKALGLARPARVPGNRHPATPHPPERR